MPDPAELERRKQEDLEFKEELARRAPQIRERAELWQSATFFFIWLLCGAALSWRFRHGILAWILAAIWLAAVFVYAAAERIVMSKVADEIQEEMNRRKSQRHE